MLKRVLYKYRNKLCRAVIVPIGGNEVQQKIIKKKELLLRSTHTITYRLFHFKETNLFSLTVPYRKTMESIQKQQFKPPSSVKGMMKLDRLKFDDVLKVPTNYMKSHLMRLVTYIYINSFPSISKPSNITTQKRTIKSFQIVDVDSIILGKPLI